MLKKAPLPPGSLGGGGVAVNPPYHGQLVGFIAGTVKCDVAAQGSSLVIPLLQESEPIEKPASWLSSGVGSPFNTSNPRALLARLPVTGLSIMT